MSGLYLHIPFCVKKCSYCDFVSYGGREELLPSYLSALKKEAEEYKNESIDTVFIGGGTPSLIGEKDFANLASFLFSNFNIAKDCEITVECNPQSVTKEKLCVYKDSGVTRVSVGAQSLSDEVLGELGRSHSLRELENAVKNIKDVSFNSFNLDLIFALPNQTVKAWEETLKKATEYSPDHISCYSLTVEPATPLGKGVISGKIKLPTEETEREMYSVTEKILKKSGLEQYEISNYAKKGKECKHNIKYWECEEYIGLGCAAHSYYKGARYRNTSNLCEYIASKGRKEDYTPLDREAMIEERIMLGLRMNRGVDIKRFEKDFGVDFLKEYGDKLKKLSSFTEFDGESLKLNGKGRDFCDRIALELLT